MKTIQTLCIILITTNLKAAPVSEENHVDLYLAEDDVQVLTVDDFKTQVENSSNAWLVEFYLSWCGACQRFAPSWKALATDIFSWRDLVKVGAVACSDGRNAPLCREYDITKYPTVKYFHENYQTSPQDLGVAFEKTSLNIDSIRHHVIDRIITEISDGRGVMYPNLLPYVRSDPSKLWETVPDNTSYIFLVVEPSETYLGVEVALDLHKTPDIVIRHTFNNHSALVNNLPLEKFPGVVVVDRNNNFEVLPGVTNSRKELKKAIATYLNDKGIKTIEENSSKGKFTRGPTPDTAQISRALLRGHVKKMGDVVFQMDLETAVRNSLKQEVAITKTIKDEKLNALVAYLDVLVKYFPFGEGGSFFFGDLANFTRNINQIDGWKIGEIVKGAEANRIFSSPPRYLACEGSASRFRRHPCSLWKLFHYLTVNSHQEDSPRQVLDAMYGYVKFFFGCDECSRHFQEMAAERNLTDVSSLDGAILWLWEAHNVVNKRLAGDETEDPEFPKRQFPSKEACPECVGSDGSWNTEEVLKYLKIMYGRYNVRYIGSDTTVVFSWLE